MRECLGSRPRGGSASRKTRRVGLSKGGVMRRSAWIGRISGNVFRHALGVAIAGLALAQAVAAGAADVPAFMKEVVVETGKPPTAAENAFNEVYALNEGMFTI